MYSNVCVCEKIGVYKSFTTIICFRITCLTFMVSQSFKVLHNIKLPNQSYQSNELRIQQVF